MSGRVASSIITTIGMPELITTTPEEYVSTAINIGANNTLFNNIRTKLVQTCLQRNPRNPYWDMQSYIRNLEKGYDEAYFNFLSGSSPRHVFISENSNKIHNNNNNDDNDTDDEILNRDEL